jgi:serine protease AprX
MQNSTISALKKLFSLALVLSFILALLFFVVRTRARPQWQQKVEEWVLQETEDQDEVEFLVVLREQADLGKIDRQLSKEEKGAIVYKLLTEVALRTQPALINDLQAAGVAYRSFWISNMIWVRGDRTLIESLAGSPDVGRIVANPAVKLDLVPDSSMARNTAEDASVEWNIDLVHAPDVWARGINGKGAVIGGQDTGYDWQHPALKQQYRGWDGQLANHSYNWYDAIHEDNPNTSSGNPCGFDSPQPCDDQSHGTHTMGTIVGQDGLENQIGMAPGAQWIACRNMEQGVGTPATYAECYQWFVAPYPQDGDPFSDGDPTKAPHVINNSWSCPASEGCVEPDVLREVVNNVRAAGIVTVHSAGNGGSVCGSVDEPAAMYDASFSVGATDARDQIAGFSSRGPSPQDEGLITKPEISAPGLSVRSSIPGDSYDIKSGTSMAAPHVAGLVALLIDARPELEGNVDLLESLIQETAVRLFTTDGCGDDSPQSIPNNTFGWGRIDAYSAYEAAVALPTPSPTPVITPTPPQVASPTPTSTMVIPANQLYIPTWFRP